MFLNIFLFRAEISSVNLAHESCILITKQNLRKVRLMVQSQVHETPKDLGKIETVHMQLHYKTANRKKSVGHNKILTIENYGCILKTEVVSLLTLHTTMNTAKYIMFLCRSRKRIR